MIFIGELERATITPIATDKALLDGKKYTVTGTPELPTAITTGSTTAPTFTGITIPPLTLGVTRTYTSTVDAAAGTVTYSVDISATGGKTDTITFTITGFEKTNNNFNKVLIFGIVGGILSILLIFPFIIKIIKKNKKK
jgi:hypothetical protein